MSTPTSPADTSELPTVPTAQVVPPDPVSVRVQADLGAASHVGLVRPHNEDCFLVGRVERALQVVGTNLPPSYGPARTEEVGYGILVADGLGGSAGGQVASRLAVASFVNLILETPDWVMRVEEPEVDRVMQRMAERFKRVSAAVAERAAADPRIAGMATTMTLACSSGSEAVVAHVGDSRAYLLRGTDLLRLTRDHTFAQDLADAGYIGQRDVAGHKFGHVLTRALGPQSGGVAVDVARVGLRDGDVLLLCTDGLTNMVPEATIAALLAGRPAQEACDALIAAALAAGGKDNVTVAVARYRIPPGL
jgi:protein phosphatase